MKKNLSVLIFSSYDDIYNPYYRGGGARAIHIIARHFARKYQVLIYSGVYPGSENKTVDGVRYQHIGLSTGNPRIDQLIFQLLLPVYVICTQFDIWFESFTPPISTAFLPLFTKKPVVGMVNLLAAENKSKEYNFPFIPLENLGLKKYRWFIVLTDYLQQKIRTINPTAYIKTIPLGAILPPGKKGKPTLKNYILFLGRLDIYHKGIDLLIKAFTKMSKKSTETLCIVGNGSAASEAYIRQKITRYGLQDQVQLVGRIEDRDKREIYKNAKFVVMPSRFEGFGIVAVEAFACSKPLLCFDISDLDWIQKGVALKAKPFSTDDLSEKMVKLSSDRRLRAELATRAKKFAEQFRWSTIFKEYDQYVTKIIKEQKSAL